MDMNSLLAMEVADLRKLAEQRGLSVTGNKQQLAKRIFEHAEANPDVPASGADQGGEQPQGETPAADAKTPPAPETPEVPAAAVEALEKDGTDLTDTEVADDADTKAMEEVTEEAPKAQFRVTPKNGVGTILGGHGVPAEGVVVPEDHPLLKFDYFLDIEALEQ